MERIQMKQVSNFPAIHVKLLSALSSYVKIKDKEALFNVPYLKQTT